MGGRRDVGAGPGKEQGAKPPEVMGVGEDVTGPDQQESPSLPGRLKTFLIGKPRDLEDKSIFRHVSLVAFLAWVGLGADGLSSSCYGPPEAFITLGEELGAQHITLVQHHYLAVLLAGAIVATVFIISTCYSHIIEEFPSGGGGYLVASKLLGKRIGVVSGCALLVDYVMTITVSIAAAGDALFSLLGPAVQQWKLPTEFALIGVLIVLNLRGVKESVQVLMPIFLLFLVAHVILIVGSIVLGAVAPKVAGEAAAQESRYLDDARTPETEAPKVAGEAGAGDLTGDTGGGASFGEAAAVSPLGLLAMLALLMRAYSLGGGTYTGLEAVSNSMPVIREPRVANAKRTMRYMAISLSLTAGGLILGYLLLGIQHSKGQQETMNYLLTQTFLSRIGLGAHWLGWSFLILTLVSEGALLIVGAQAGFIDGPRVLGYMAHDSWVPRWFSSLSERLATENGILLMGLSALAALWYTKGNVRALVIMYSINVFLTFSLSMIGMCRHWYGLRKENPLWRRRLALFVVGAVLCASILTITVYLKFPEGGWLTVAMTGLCVAVAFSIHRYYKRVGEKLKVLDETLSQIPTTGEPNMAPTDPAQPTAIILVGGYSGLGIHTMLNVPRFVPNHFRSFVFVSVGVVDSGNFKGTGAVEDLREHTQQSLDRYVDLARRLGIPAEGYMAIGTDAVDDLEKLCLEVAKKYPRSTVFAGQLVFEKDSWLHRLLHNQTAFSLQRRLQWAGLPMVILPTRVR